MYTPSGLLRSVGFPHKVYLPLKYLRKAHHSHSMHVRILRHVLEPPYFFHRCMLEKVARCALMRGAFVGDVTVP